MEELGKRQRYRGRTTGANDGIQGFPMQPIRVAGLVLRVNGKLLWCCIVLQALQSEASSYPTIPKP